MLWGAERISLEKGRRLGRLLARGGTRVRPKDRQRALSNLALAFPELDDEARQSLFEESVLALGENFFDTLAAPELLRQEQLVQEEIKVDGLGLIQEVQDLASGGSGVLLLTGHLGCWELLGGWLAKSLGCAGLGPLAVVTGSIHNPPVDRLVQERRMALGMKVLPRSGGAGPVLRHLQNGGVVAVLLDQNTQVLDTSLTVVEKTHHYSIRIATGGGRELVDPKRGGYSHLAVMQAIHHMPFLIHISGSRDSP